MLGAAILNQPILLDVLETDLGQRLLYKAFSFLKHPSLLLSGASLCRYENKACIRIPYAKRNLNMLNAIAFGPILTGAECAAYFPIAKYITYNNLKVKGLVKSGSFDIKRACRSDIVFVPQISEASHVLEGNWKSKRLSNKVIAKNSTGEEVAEFNFEIVLKK